ncbi:MAG: hypothetical protein GC160_04880 [Acidobacteria bacterium]|nr:hypothetical protein [Acidobacteriota bacterium]
MVRAWAGVVCAAWILGFCFDARAHPVFVSSSVVNAASYQPPEFASGAIAQGSIFSVFGKAVGPLTAVQATTFPLSPSLGGVTITVSRAGFPDIAVIPLFVSEAQVNAIMPSNAPIGPATLRIRFDDRDGNANSVPVDVTIAPSAVGLFTVNASGRGPAIANNYVSAADQPLNSTERSARPGQVITLWATGLGAIAGADNLRPLDAGAVVDLSAQAGLEVFVGGAKATNVLYAGRSPEFAGLDQIVVEVPSDASEGCYAPLWFRVAGGVVSNVATLSIDADGGRCDDPLAPHVGPAGADRIGLALLSRVLFEAGSVSDTQDTGAGSFEALNQRGWHFNPAFSLPPLGSCAVYTERDSAGGIRNVGPDLRFSSPLDAGQLIVRGPGGSRFLTTTPGTGLYETLFSSPQEHYLEPGGYTLEGKGTAAVGTFQAGAETPAPPAWTIQGGGSAVDRSAGLTVEWTPADAAADYVRILLISSDAANNNNNVTSTLFCTAPADAGRFTIHADYLANVPASAGSGVSSTAALFVGLASLPARGAFAAEGLDAGFFTAFALRGKPVTVR